MVFLGFIVGFLIFSIVEHIIEYVKIAYAKIFGARKMEEYKLMSAIQNLTDAVTGLQEQVALAVTAIQNGKTQDPAIQAAADSVNAETQKIKDALV